VLHAAVRLARLTPPRAQPAVEPAAAQTQAQERTRVEESSGLSGRRRPQLKGTRRGGQIGSLVVDGGGGDAAPCAEHARVGDDGVNDHGRGGDGRCGSDGGGDGCG
jgi:hypothetical protein